MKIEGYYNIKPRITKITLKHHGLFDLHLKDGRVVSVPVSKFPDIAKLSPSQLKKWYILDDTGFSFDDCDEVYHIEQVLGKYEDYKYSFLNEPFVKYKTRKIKKNKSL